MNWAIILEIGKYVLGFIVGVVPTVVGLFLSIKKIKTAENEKDKAAAKTDLLEKARLLIGEAEVLYGAVDSALKQQGGSAGALKKDSVMNKLKSYAIDNGYDFDEEFYNEQVEKIVSLTKSVNAR